VRREVDRLIDDQAFLPMWGLAGGDRIVNVLELNLALDEALRTLAVE
jgi:K+-transporting ATPase c subunit